MGDLRAPPNVHFHSHYLTPEQAVRTNPMQASHTTRSAGSAEIDKIFLSYQAFWSQLGLANPNSACSTFSAAIKLPAAQHPEYP
mmetsp:Transcript_17247/g.32447  ORF Transcript_17247/g.32447 Transcript_17247/m.32447 type:complete len:84 (-) Transcript_17247:7-258(-)